MEADGIKIGLCGLASSVAGFVLGHAIVWQRLGFPSFFSMPSIWVVVIVVGSGWWLSALTGTNIRDLRDTKLNALRLTVAVGAGTAFAVWLGIGWLFFPPLPERPA